ncbi:MAG: sugar ABC transporter substrate-binding protein [Lachnospiraceae bacterium]
MKKKLMAAVMVASMLVSGVTGCSSSKPAEVTGSQVESLKNTEADTASSGDSFIIGYPVAPSLNSTMSAMMHNRAAVAEAAGGKLITEVFDFTPEGTVNAVEKLIQSGCDGIFVTPMADSILPSIVKLCEESETYFVISMRTISDPEVKAIVEASPYYVGMVYEDDISAGYAMGKALADAGGKEYAIVSTALGDTTGALREQGLSRAAEEFGMTQVAEVRALAQASDGSKAAESFIASYPELDGIIRVASTAPGDVNAIAAAIEASGKGGEIKFITVDTEDGSGEYFEKGTIEATLNILLIHDSVVASVLLVNAIQGTPLGDGFATVGLEYSLVENAEELNFFNEYVAVDTPIYNKEEIQQLFLKSYNPNITLEGVIEEISSQSASSVAARKNAK